MSKPESLVPAEPDEHTGSLRPWWLMLGLSAFVFAVYSPSYGYGFIDDEIVILFRSFPPRTIGELIGRLWAPHFPGLEYFRPIPHATYLLQYMWHRNDPGLFHLFNAGLMSITACVVFAFLRLPCFRINTMFAALAAALFAVHPASSSCVTPIVGRETLFGACLTISAVYAYLRGGAGWYAGSLCLFFLALLSKEQGIVIPVLFVLADLTGLSTDAPGRQLGRWLRRYSSVAVLVVIYLAMRWSLFTGTEYTLRVLEHPLGPVQSIGYALQTVFVPFAELAYEPALSVWLSWWRLAIAGVLFVATGWALIRNSQVSRAVPLFWLGWFLVTIAPTANVIEQQAPYSERYILLATLAVLAATAMAGSAIQQSSNARPIAVVLGLTLIGVAAAMTIYRGSCFESQLTFARQRVRTSPTFGEARTGLGIQLHRRGDHDEAAECFRAGTECEPASRSYCHQWLGTTLIIQHRPAEAQEQFQLLIDENPRDSYSCYLSGVALRRLGETGKACDRFRQAVATTPNLGGAHFLLADTLAKRQESQLTREHSSIASRMSDIDLSFSDITDLHLRKLSRSTELRFLRLDYTPISDDGLKHLQGMSTLSRLWLLGTPITDRGLFYLRGVPNLNSLVLINTRITDDGVAHLQSMKNLKHLDIRYTKITRQGVSRIVSTLPECLIMH